MNTPMKIIVSTLFLLLFGCDTDSLKNEKSQNEYDQKIEQELKSGVLYDEIFMTFKFGDSENDVKNKFRQLKDSGRLNLDDKKRYVYKFVFDEYEFTNGSATFSQKYHDGKLYQFRMMVEPHDDMKALGGSGSSKFIQMNSEGLLYRLAMLYMEKYGVPIDMKNVLLNTNDLFWIKGNREIEISLGNGFVNVFYTDLLPLKRIEEEKVDKFRNEAKITKKEI